MLLNTSSEGTKKWPLHLRRNVSLRIVFEISKNRIAHYQHNGFPCNLRELVDPMYYDNRWFKEVLYAWSNQRGCCISGRKREWVQMNRSGKYHDRKKIIKPLIRKRVAVLKVFFFDLCKRHEEHPLKSIKGLEMKASNHFHHWNGGMYFLHILFLTLRIFQTQSITDQMKA